MIMKSYLCYFAIIIVVCMNNVFAQECLIPCYLYNPNIQTAVPSKDNDVDFNMIIRYISDSELSMGPVISSDTSDDCNFITLKTDTAGNWFIKSEDTYLIFYDKNKDYLSDCSMQKCERTILSKRHQLIVKTEHLYPFEILFWGVTSCDTPTYLFHKTYGIVGIKDHHMYYYFRKDFLEYLLQQDHD